MSIFVSNRWNLTKQMILLLSLSGLAGSALGNVCKDDISALCDEVKAQNDRKAIMQCLESHKSELSSECAERVDKMMERREKSSNKNRGGACSDAVKQYCPDAHSEGRGAVLTCLESHKSELSSECAEKVDKMQAQ